MFHPPQAVIGLALLPMTWASSTAAAERPRIANGAEQRARADDLARYFPAGWSRESVPAWPAVGARVAEPLPQRVKSRWRASGLAALFARSGDFVRRRLLRRPAHRLPPRQGLSRG